VNYRVSVIFCKRIFDIYFQNSQNIFATPVVSSLFRRLIRRSSGSHPALAWYGRKKTRAGRVVCVMLTFVKKSMVSPNHFLKIPHMGDARLAPNKAKSVARHYATFLADGANAAPTMALMPAAVLACRVGSSASPSIILMAARRSDSSRLAM